MAQLSSALNYLSCFPASADKLPSSSSSTLIAYIVQRLAASPIFYQSEPEKLSHTLTHTHTYKPAPAKMRNSFCFISLATNMLEGCDIFHLKGWIHCSVWMISGSREISKSKYGVSDFKDIRYILDNLVS